MNEKRGPPANATNAPGDPRGPKPNRIMTFGQYKAKHGHKLPPEDLAPLWSEHRKGANV